MKSIRFRLMAAALAVLMGSAIAKSQTAEEAPPPPARHSHQFRMDSEAMGFLIHRLNLTDEQKAQMTAVMKKEHPAMRPLFEQQHQLDVQLRQYVEGTYDEAKVQALAAQKAQVEAQLTVAQTRVHNQLFTLLTPDQQSQLKQLEAEHDARAEERINHHGSEVPRSE